MRRARASALAQSSRSMRATWQRSELSVSLRSPSSDLLLDPFLFGPISIEFLRGIPKQPPPPHGYDDPVEPKTDERQQQQHRELPRHVHGEIHALDQHAE